MPELPEVETLCRQLREVVVGKKIKKMIVYDSKLKGIENPDDRTICEVFRWGKNILLLMDNGRSVIIHLRMTGRLFWRKDDLHERHLRWRIVLEDGKIDLVDPRRFATVRIEKAKYDQDKKDLITGFDMKDFFIKQAQRKVNVKNLLMDNTAMHGIGNIYACEILHRARISPLRISNTLTKEEWKNVFNHARRILKKGIEKRGTSISDWRDLYGLEGENQKELKVYGREGKSCYKCRTQIKRIKQGGRSTFYCPGCQK